MRWPADCFPRGCRSKRKRPAMRRANVADAGSQFPWMKSPGDSSRPNEEKPAGKNPSDVASDVGRLFFPQSQALGIAPDDTASPRVLEKIVYAGTQSRSFRQAERDLKHLAELDISEQRIARATKRIGQERVAERKAQEAAWETLSLPEQQGSPCEQAPQVACVEPDGGRIQIRERNAEEPPEEEGRKGRYWRETKVGCLLSMTSETFETDPCPTIPEIFVDPRRMGQISREIKGFSAVGEPPSPRESAETPASLRTGEGISGGLSQFSFDENGTVPFGITTVIDSPVLKRQGQPEPLVRSVVATREPIEAFGKQLAAASWRRGFMAAERKAFVGDGSETNWSIWRRHFSHFTPIVDFIHALCYVFAAAMAGRISQEAWPIYCQWAQWLWSGQVELVIAALRERQQELGRPEKNEAEESPRCKVADALCYLENQRARMRYDEYRRKGLPITSSHIESTIKQINRRVKGTEKFWSSGGADALLQLVADYLSDTQPLTTFWRDRMSQATGQRHYQSAG
jgi:hypothetical protein